MFDPMANRLLRWPLDSVALMLRKRQVHPDHVTLAGFGFGLVAAIMIWAGWYTAGLCFILINRVMDGLDGALARQTRATDAGGFLDICLDFLFYSIIVTGFALSDPAANAVAAVILLFCFVGTGTSFLAFAIMAQKHDLDNMAYPNKSMYYMGGLTEGTETIFLFILICLFPGHFSLLAYGFAVLCVLTTVSRIVSGYLTLKTIREKTGNPPE